PHGDHLEHVDEVPDLPRVRGAERIGVVVQVQARDLGQGGARVEFRVGLTGEHLDRVSECRQLTAEVTDVDALASAVWLAPVREQRDPHGRSPPSWSSARRRRESLAATGTSGKSRTRSPRSRTRPDERNGPPALRGARGSGGG